MPTRTDPESLASSTRRYWVKKSPRKLIAESERKETRLKKSLTWFDLTALGVGGIIGVGIFVLTGTAAYRFAGDGITISYLLAGFVCVFAALSYAELASMIPVSGSAYTYAYASLGELIAWVIGWALFLEYMVGAMAVAVGWSGHLVEFVDIVLGPIGIPEISERWANGPFVEGAAGIMNLPALVGVLLLTLVLIVGIKGSARTAGLLVVLKVSIIVFIVFVGFFFLNPENWFNPPHTPCMDPAQTASCDRRGLAGIFTAAGVVFFAYIGFDAVSTAAEETRNPRRDLPIGIIASLAISTLLYVLASLTLTGLIAFPAIDTVAPFPAAFADRGQEWAAGLIAGAAMAGITSVLLVLMLGQTRIFFALSRDGLLPGFFSRVHARFRTPHVATAITGVAIAVVAAFLPIDFLAQMTSIATLFAFVLANLGVAILRKTAPDMPRGFRVPGAPWTPIVGAFLNLVLMFSLQLVTWVTFIGWMGLGLLIYALYGIHHSKLFRELLAGRRAAAAADGGSPDPAARAPRPRA